MQRWLLPLVWPGVFLFGYILNLKINMGKKNNIDKVEYKTSNRYFRCTCGKSIKPGMEYCLVHYRSWNKRFGEVNRKKRALCSIDCYDLAKRNHMNKSIVKNKDIAEERLYYSEPVRYRIQE